MKLKKVKIMKKNNYIYILNIILPILSIQNSNTHAKKEVSLLEHHNISFQKNYEAKWKQLFDTSLTDNPIALANQFKTALEKNTFLSFSNQPFYLGLSSSAYQFEGGIGDESSWHRFALKRGHALPGKACNFWDNYKEMIKQMKEECHINSFRLSISWERLQKKQRSFDYVALAKYKDIIRELKNNGIEPLVVLHHYTIPTWFEDLGGFEKEENITYFVEFAKEVYKALADEVTYWSTFNAIEGYAFKGYYTLDGAPGIKKDMQTTTEVMCNMLKAHVAIYRAIKGITAEQSAGLWQQLQEQHPDTNLPCPQIGIQKNIMFLDLAYDSWMHYVMAPTSWALCCMGNLMQNDGFYDFFNLGTFKIYIPFMVDVSYTDYAAPFTLDWIGVNTYANQKRFLMSVVEDKDEQLTTLNKNYRYYPQGLYRAVKEIQKRINGGLYTIDRKLLRNRTVPIWITENGIAAHSDEQREDFFKKTLFIVTKLLQEPLPIIGYTPWAAFDNYEWGSKKLGDKRYGMLHYYFPDPNQKQLGQQTKPTLKSGSLFFAQFCKEVNHFKTDLTIH
ncbi:MAG TPA: family 1 glycosylhydrolase [Patescibacteria group bacterium]|jgi:beta-glucosidase|nr:family 1 glycosylhydrolase [Patescibacteria group bacterium]